MTFHIFRWSIDLSADGSVLALGTGSESQEATDRNSGIHVLKWNGTLYSPFLNRLPAGETSAVSLSRDGKALAVGLPFYGKKGGTTTVYQFQPPKCDGNSKLLRLSFTTDEKPDESRWTIQVGPSIMTQSNLYNDLPFTTFVEELCVPADACIKFRALDSAGDGLDPPAGYALMLDGIEVANGGDFRIGEIQHIGNCDCPAGHSLLSIIAKDNGHEDPEMEWALSYQNRTSAGEYFFRRTMHDTIEIFEQCIPEGCWQLTNPQCSGYSSCVVTPEWLYNVTYKGWSQSDKGSCGFCPIDIAFGECLPIETAAVQYERTYSPTPSY